VTGGTGFIGIYLIKKLISTKNGDHVQLLIRGNPLRLFTEILSQPIFSQDDIEYCKKYVSVISGDINDVQLDLVHVDIVYHCAATVNFNLPLHDALQNNVHSLIKIINSFHEGGKLVFVSTAYVHLPNDRTVHPCQLVDIPTNIDKIVNGQYDGTNISKMWPNTYTFSKAIAEHVLVSKCSEKQIQWYIVRPSCVTEYGLIRTKLSGVGMYVYCILKGLIKTVHSSSNNKLNIVPVETVVEDICCFRHGCIQHSTSVNQPSIGSIIHTCNQSLTFACMMTTNVIFCWLYEYILWIVCILFNPKILEKKRQFIQTLTILRQQITISKEVILYRSRTRLM